LAIEVTGHVPTAEDLADLAAWSEELDRRRDLEAMRRWYEAHPIAASTRIGPTDQRPRPADSKNRARPSD
jgi:hypothetical protein